MPHIAIVVTRGIEISQGWSAKMMLMILVVTTLWLAEYSGAAYSDNTAGDDPP